MVASKSVLGSFTCMLLLAVVCVAQQDTSPVQGNAGQASQPGGVSSGAANAGATGVTSTPRAGLTANAPLSAKPSSASSATDSSTDDNPYDPFLEPPPLPKGKPTLIGGIASNVDHVRNRLTVTPFGKGQKIKLFVDERSHIYRNGTETTVLGIHKGDRVYADTMLDGSRIFAKNIRVITESGIAEVRGQVLALDPASGTISVRDQLSAKPVSFSVSGATKYRATKGDATAGDIQVGSLIDVQFSPDHANRDLAQEVIVLAKPGDNYVFSGVVTSLDMRTSTVSVSNRSDEQTYDLHFDPTQLKDPRLLKVGSEVTARAVFDGKQYKTSNLRVEAEGEKTEVR